MRNYFAFSLHKSGSTLLYKLLHQSARRSQESSCNRRLEYVSIPDQLFNAGIPGKVLFDERFEPPVPLDRRDTIYGGFRFVPGFIGDRHLADAGVMILVRDPRDVLTSLYYSVSSSHSIPGGEAGENLQKHRRKAAQTDIDTFVVTQSKRQNWVERYARIASLRNRAKCWRYEDVVFNKRDWYDEILDFLELDLPRHCRQQIIEHEDIVPASDRPDAHIRQVTPGDHRRKLKPETIAVLEGVFAECLSTWGYSG